MGTTGPWRHNPKAVVYVYNTDLWLWPCHCQFGNSCINFRTKSRKNSGIIVALPNPDSKPMIHSLERGNTRRAATPACLRHRVQEKYLLDPRVQQCHHAHNAELVHSEESETCQQVLIAVLIVRRIPSNGCQLARVGCFADDIKYRMSERVMCGRVSVTCDKELGKVVLISIWTKYEGNDGELYW